MFLKKIKNNWPVLLLLLLLAAGFYLRFFNIEENIEFTWDQGRDAQAVKSIIEGNLILYGPRTGIGHFHLGPVYYYLLIPFFLLARMDPMALNYFNMLAFVVNFLILFFVFKKLFSEKAALFSVFIYSLSGYIIQQGMTPWNVSLIPGVSILIFYSLCQIQKGKFASSLVLASLAGFFFHLHFTAIFIPMIILFSLIFVKNKKRLFVWLAACLPLFLIWLVPNYIFNLRDYQSDYYKMREFFSSYLHGFYPRFMLYRMNDAFLHFESVLKLGAFRFFKFVLPLIFIGLSFFEKEKIKRVEGYLVLLWFLVPLIGFTLYSGPISDYYFMMTTPFVIYIIVYLNLKIIQLVGKKALLILLFFWTIYAYQNTQPFWFKPNHGGLKAQKEFVRGMIEKGEGIEYVEGDIKSYLYSIWTNDREKKN